MKLFNIFSLGVLMACTFSSCEMKKELTSDFEESYDMGALELDVTVKQPVSNSRVDANVSTDNFPVIIQGASEGIEDVIKEYSSVLEVPESVKLPIGNYSVTSHSAGDLQQKMDSPYYLGSTDITISKDIQTVANVVCKMANSRIQINYGDDFKASFSSWTITLDVGPSSVLSYTEQDVNMGPIYWLFDENVTSITVNITAITTSGNTVRDRRVFTKSDVAENYEDVSEAFVGGDAIEINMGTVESLTGEVVGITVNTNITFENHEETVEIPAYEENTDTGGEEENPTPDGAVTLNLPEDVTYSITAGNAPSSADAYIASEAGLKKIVVTIVAGNDAFQAILLDLQMDGQSFLAENGGVNIVDNADFGELVSTVGSQAPAKGCKEYTFPIGAFFTFLNMTGATDEGKSHEFHMTVTDMEGNEATGIFKVTINE